MNAPVFAPAPTLIGYDQACRALAQARAVDEVKDVSNRADALRIYAKQAKNKQLEIDASEIRFRAERRIGELLAERRATKSGCPVGRPPNSPVARTEYLARRRKTLLEEEIGEQLGFRARRYAAIPADDFEALLATRRNRLQRDGGRITVNLLDEQGRAERRAAREADLGARTRAWPSKRYGVILGDPEWEYVPWSRATGMDRSAANHYPTSSLTEICARDVAAIAAPDCVYALWAIVPMLAEAFCVLDAHGFGRFERDAATGFLTIDKSAGRYVSSGVWTKYKPNAGIGMGHWFRVDHEILLLATRGNPPAPAPGRQARSVFDVPASRVHSQKPEVVAEILESYYPNLPKIELNRRGPPRPGWDAWGQEAETAEVAA